MPAATSATPPESSIPEVSVQSELKKTAAPTLSKKECCGGDKNCETCLKGGMPMKKELLSFITILMVGLSTLFFTLWVVEMRKSDTLAPTTPVRGEETMEVMKYTMPVALETVETIALPEPRFTGKMSVEQAIHDRRSQRVFTDEAVSMADLSQMLWSAQGLTDESGHRTAPSARGVYPHDLYVVVRNVEGLDQGLYLYKPETHSLADVGVANAGNLLIQAEVQENSQTAPVVIVMATAFAKAQEKFPDTAQSVSDLEAGHIGQNVYLQAQSLGLGTVVTAGFNSEAVTQKLGLDPNYFISYLIPFGHPAPVEEEAAH